MYMITSHLKACLTLTFIIARRARALFLLSAERGVKQCVLTRKRMRVPHYTIYFLLQLLQGLVAKEYLLFASSTEPDTNLANVTALGTEGNSVSAAKWVRGFVRKECMM